MMFLIFSVFQIISSVTLEDQKVNFTQIKARENSKKSSLKIYLNCMIISLLIFNIFVVIFLSNSNSHLEKKNDSLEKKNDAFSFLVESRKNLEVISDNNTCKKVAITLIDKILNEVSKEYKISTKTNGVNKRGVIGTYGYSYSSKNLNQFFNLLFKTINIISDFKNCDIPDSMKNIVDPMLKILDADFKNFQDELGRSLILTSLEKQDIYFDSKRRS